VRYSANGGDFVSVGYEWFRIGGEEEKLEPIGSVSAWVTEWDTLKSGGLPYETGG